MLTPRKRQTHHDIYRAGGFVTAPALCTGSDISQRSAAKMLAELAAAGYLEEAVLRMSGRYPKIFRMTRTAAHALGKPPLSLPDDSYPINVITRQIECHAVMELRATYSCLLSENAEKVAWLMRRGCTEEMLGYKTLRGKRYPHCELHIIPDEERVTFVHGDRPNRDAIVQLANRLSHIRPLSPLLPAVFIVCVDNDMRQMEYIIASDMLGSADRQLLEKLAIYKINTQYSL